MQQSDRTLIFSGGRLGPWAENEIREGDFLIGADRGALYLIERGWHPDISLGDFDSVPADKIAFIRQHSASFANCDPIKKDLTDTEWALLQAIEMKPREILIFGALGSRLDHSLANIHLLELADENGIRCRIIDDCNQLFTTAREMELYKGRFPYVSLLSVTDQTTGIYLDGFVYPLVNATLSRTESRGISNQLMNEHGTIRLNSGRLLVVQSCDN